MNESNQIANVGENEKAAELFARQYESAARQTDRMIAYVLPLQLFAIVAASIMLDPRGWNGFGSMFESNVRLTVVGGGLLTVIGLMFTILLAGRPLTKYVVAICQMAISVIVIESTGGHIGAHFHVIGSLVLLSSYQDWRVLVPATLVTVVQHILSRYFAGSFADVSEGNYHWFEHIAWVLFTDIFLFVSCKRSASSMWRAAKHNALLEMSEERYRTVIEQMTESIFLLDPGTLRVVDCNNAFVRLLGCASIEEARSLRARDFDRVPEAELARMCDIVVKEGRSLTAVRRYTRRDGAIIDVELTGSLIAYNRANVFCINARDITERKRADVELKRLALVAKSTHNAVIITDPKGLIQWVNDGFTRLTGYEFSEVVGRRPGSFLQGEKTDVETVLAIRAAIAACEPFRGEIYNYGKNGAGYWLSISIVPITNRRGELKGFIAIEMDITERKLMEEQLKLAYDELESRIAERTAELVLANEQMKVEMIERKRAEAELGEAQQFLRKVIDDIPSLIFVKDAAGRFLLVNRALAKMFGTRPEKMIGKTYRDFNPNSAEVDLYEADDRHVIENLEQKIVHEERLTDCNGNVHWLQTIKRPLIGDEGVESIVGIATDLTERKILESQLRHSQKLESIGQLAAGIAHEINTPTQYVGDNARFIRDAFEDLKKVLEKYGDLFEHAKAGDISQSTLDAVAQELIFADLDYVLEEVPKAIQQSLDGVGRIAKIVQSMKDFAHPGSSEKKTADLNKAIESTITVARNEWKYVADIETNFDPNLPLVPCLLGEINQVVLNMIINASHAIADVVGDGSHGKGKITVTTTKVSDDWAEIRIGDTGTGIPPAVQGKIFDPFFTTKEVGRGTGQGLAISHTVVVDKHHGKLSFVTTPGAGTTFVIGLPINEVDEGAATSKG